MEYEPKNGKVVNDEILEAMAVEWESGQWSGHLEEVEKTPVSEGLDSLPYRLARVFVVPEIENS